MRTYTIDPDLDILDAYSVSHEPTEVEPEPTPVTLAFAQGTQPPTRTMAADRQTCPDTGKPLTAYNWTRIRVTPEMQELANAIHDNSAARRKMVARTVLL